MTTLQNKTALVTGASRGISRPTALALARAGAHVLVHYGRSTQEAKSLVAEIQTKGGRADAISADLGTPDGASLLAKQARSTVGHSLEFFVLAVAAGGARPLELQRLELLAQFDDAILADVERVVVEENLLHLWEIFDGLLHFAGHILRGTRAPGVP